MKVVVVAVGGFHVGYLGCYGNDWVETPSLDRLAAEGVVFDQHYADCPDGAAARRAWRTGRYRIPTGNEQPPGASDDLVELARAAGVFTSVILDADSPDLPEFTRGWDKAYRVTPGPPGESSAEPLTSAVAAALDGLAGVDRWLLWVDVATLIPPWTIPDELVSRYFGQDEEDEEPPAPLTNPPAGVLVEADEETFFRLQNTYAGAVTYLDEILESLFDALRQRRLFEESLIVVTSDRGAALGEHGVVGDYRPWLHEELVHLPLIVRLPGGAAAGTRIPALTQPVDLMPTLLDAFGLAAADAHGHSLLPLILADACVPSGDSRTESVVMREYACSGSEAEGAVEWSLRTHDWAFLLPVRQPEGDARRAVQLYVKPDDRWEVNNVLQHYLDLAERMEKTLRAFVEAAGRRGPVQQPELRLDELAAKEQDTPESPAVDPEGTSHEHGQTGG